jgi:hypothetical protein
MATETSKARANVFMAGMVMAVLWRLRLTVTKYLISKKFATSSPYNHQMAKAKVGL